MSKIAVKNAVVSPDLLKIPHGRQAAIKHYSSFGFQKNHTPFDIAGKMVDQLGDLSGKTFRILFNLEFLEELFVRGVAMESIQFIADTPQERRFAKLVYGVETVLAGEHTWKRILKHKKKKASELLERVMAKRRIPLNKAADITLSNPPYNGGIDLKIIMAMNNAGLLKRLVCVHPSTWLVDVKTQLGTKSGNSTFRKFQDSVRDHVTSTELFNGNIVFGIGLYVPCVITDVNFDSTRKGSIKVKDVGSEETREVLGVDDITLHGKDWDPTVKEFMNRVQAYCAANGSMGSARQPDPSMWVRLPNPVQLAPLRGNVNFSCAQKMVKTDFYTFLQGDVSKNKGIRKYSGVSVEQYHSVGFSTVTEQDNCINYLTSDFSRLCLSLLKTNNKTLNQEASLIPWLDFTRSWNDDELFTLLGYAKGHPIREYAKRFLPDYHNIYPNGKTY